MRRARIELTCTGCNKKFLRHACHVKKGFKTAWCSRACWTRSTLKTYICFHCGKTGQRHQSQKVRKFCSNTCYYKSVGRIEEKNCEQCGKGFKPTQRIKANRFCSAACYGKSMRIDPEVYRQRRNAYTRQYRKEHPDWVRVWKNKRRALEVGAEGHYTLPQWEAVKKKFKNRCANCKRKRKLTVDHIKSLSRGGSNYIENIQPLCGSCNSSKWIKELNGQRYSLNTAGMS